LKMATAQNTQNKNGANNAKVTPDGFTKAQAHAWAPDAYSIKPRRQHLGPPAGMEERRKVMYAGRMDHIRLAEKRAKEQAAKEQSAAQAAKPAPQPAPAAAPVAPEPAPHGVTGYAKVTTVDALASLLLREMGGQGALVDALVRALMTSTEPGLTGEIDPFGTAWPTPAEHKAVMAEPEPAKPAKPAAEVGRAPARKPAQKAAAPFPSFTPPAALLEAAERTQAAEQAAKKAQAAPVLSADSMMDSTNAEIEAMARQLDRRTERKGAQVAPDVARRLRQFFARVDALVNSEEYDDPATWEKALDFAAANHSEKYKKIFLWALHKEYSARQAHNIASLKAYGKKAILV
jgi:hypothetical protein